MSFFEAMGSVGIRHNSGGLLRLSVAALGSITSDGVRWALLRWCKKVKGLVAPEGTWRAWILERRKMSHRSENGMKPPITNPTGTGPGSRLWARWTMRFDPGHEHDDG